jgi:hypothetical protein
MGNLQVDFIQISMGLTNLHKGGWSIWKLIVVHTAVMEPLVCVGICWVLQTHVIPVSMLNQQDPGSCSEEVGNT